MTHQTRVLTTAAALLGAIALGGCALPMHKDGPKGGPKGGPIRLTALQTLQVQDANGNGIFDAAEKVLSVKQCSSEPCEVTITPAPKVAPNLVAGFDCGIRLSDEVLVFSRQITRLSWLLAEPAGASVDYRFTPLPADPAEPYGIFLYADPGKREFSVAQATAQRFVLARQVRQQAGFAYGVYLQWKPKGASDKEWQACNPLDPVIIELN